MNIHEITSGQATAAGPATVKHVTPSAIPDAASSSRTDISSDKVNTSVFSKLMQRGARELREHLQPRPEAIARWSGKLEEPVNLSEAVIQTVARSMVGA